MSEEAGYCIEITKVDTQEIRIDHTHPDKDKDLSEAGEDALIYSWLDGSFSCDCNRYIVFQHASKEEVLPHKCSYGLYDVKITHRASGRVLMDEASNLIPVYDQWAHGRKYRI